MAESQKEVNGYEVRESELQKTTPTSEPLKDDMDSSSSLKKFFRTLSFRKPAVKEEPERKCNMAASDTLPFSSSKPNSVAKIKKSSTVKNFPHGQKSSMSILKRYKSKDVDVYDSFIHNIPPKPLSVLQINELLKSNSLQEAYQHLLSLRLEFEREKETQDEKDSKLNLARKEKDLNLLYETLREKITNIIRHSVSLPRNNKKLLICIACIIREEEKREGDVVGMGGWIDVWRAAVQEGVRDTLSQVHLDSHEQNSSWLALHLGLLGKTIVEQLEDVKAELVNLYPTNFNVFETYSSSCHRFVGEHLKVLLGKVTELNDVYTLLDFSISQYYSKEVLGRPSLQPEMNEKNAPPLSDDLLDQIKNKYCDCLQKHLHTSVDDIIKHEQEEVWNMKRKPTGMEDGKFPTSEIHTKICKVIDQYANKYETFDVKLKERVLHIYLDTLKLFTQRFEEKFLKHSKRLLKSELLDCCLCATYDVAYINSFSILRDHVNGCLRTSPDQTKQLESDIDGLALRLRQALLEQFRVEIKPYMDNMMTKKWLNTDTDFNELIKSIEMYSGYKKSMRPVPAQSFANEVHFYVMKEYISQLLKNKYSCKGRKNESAAAKIRQQWEELKSLFCEMESTLDWLHPLGDQLSQIIKQENDRDIKNLLKPLVENYPDISKKHLLGILYFRDCKLAFEKFHLIQHFTELKENFEKTENAGNAEHKLFSVIK